MTLASWFDLIMGWGFGMIGIVCFFLHTSSFVKGLGLRVGIRRSFSRDLPSRWEPKWDPYHSHTNRRDSKMGVKSPTSEGVWQLKKAYALSIGWHSPFLQKGACAEGEPTNRVECGWGYWYRNINYIFANSFVLQNCWRQHPGVIKLPIFAGIKLNANVW